MPKLFSARVFMSELVVLVDEQNNELGTAPKDTVHTTNTPLHRGFSLFAFNTKGQLLLTKRSFKKRTFPGVWTNTVCGHPAPGESAFDAAKRRLKEELGISLEGSHPTRLVRNLREVAPYRYRFADKNGIVENEICPILVVHADTDPKPDKNEVEDWKWMRWEDFLKDVQEHSEQYSPWSVEEVKILRRFMRY